MDVLSNICLILLLRILVISIDCARIKWQDTKFKLQRRKHDVFSDVPIWTVSSNGLNYKGFYGKNHLICQDPLTGATFMPIHECSDLNNCDLKHYTGVFGREVSQSIVNLGEKHCHEVVKREASKRDYFKRDNDTEVYDGNRITHIAQRYGIYAYQEIEEDDHHGHRSTRSVTENQFTNLEIKLLVVLDYALYKLLGEDFEYIAQYMNVFWSAIDLKFKMIDYPFITLKIVGIIISEEKKFLKYVDDNPYDEEDTLDIKAALDRFKEIKSYLNETIPEYHAIITVSGLRGQLDYEACFGMAYYKAVCAPIANGAIITDDGEYFGINNAVHELGHLLGLRHDGFDAEHFKGCQQKEPGYHHIMFKSNPGGFDELKWSNCSLNYFYKLQSDKAVKCCAK